jgi:PilZ domain
MFRPMSSRTNRRRHPRVEGQGITGHVKHEGEVLLALPIENISVGGMLLRCTEPLPVGNQVFLELARPGMKAFKLVGRVLGVVPLKKTKDAAGTYGLSIRFNPMGEELTQRLQELVEAIYRARGVPDAPAEPVRVALQQPPKPRPPSPDFDFEFAGHEALAENEVSAAVVGTARVSGGQFERPSGARAAFDFSFGEPLALHAQEPMPVAVPASAKLTAQLRAQDATADELRAMVEERDRELKQLKDELARKNEQLEKLRRAVLELRHRNKPVL